MTAKPKATNTETTDTPNDENVADFALAAERQGKEKYTLEYPVEFGGDELKELWMRRPLLLDKTIAERQVKDGSPYEMTANILANVCDVGIDVIWELDEEYDFTQLIKQFNALEEIPEISENTLTLKYPFELNGKRIESLTIRRPKARDSLEYQDEKLGDKMARLCGYELKDLHDMDLKTDWMGLERVYHSFRKKRIKRKSA